MKRSSLTPLGMLMALLAAGAVQAADLTDVANAAWDYDGTWRADRKTWEAEQETLVQGRAALLPTIDASHRHSEINQTYESTGDLEIDGRSRSTSVTLTQPLFRLDAFYGYKEAKSLTSVAQAEFYQSRQDFVLRVAQGYFGVLRAWDTLVSAQAEEKAISRQLEQSQERFDVGLVASTDVEEARAAYDLARVNLIVAEQEFDIARDQLETLTGRKWETLAELRDDLPMEGPQPSKMNAWIDKAAYQNPQILAARYSAKAAGFTADRQLGPCFQRFSCSLSINTTTIPIQASRGDPGNQLTQFYSTQPDTNSKTIGIEVTVPLFAVAASTASASRRPCSPTPPASGTSRRSATSASRRAPSTAPWKRTPCAWKRAARRSAPPAPPWKRPSPATRWAPATWSTCSTPSRRCTPPSGTTPTPATTTSWTP